jgi:hypothetical protein
MRTSTKITAVVAGGALVVATAGTTAGTLSLAGGSGVTGLIPGTSVDVPITASNASTTTSLQAATLTVSNLHSTSAACDALAAGAKATAVATSPASPVTVAPSGSAAFGKVTISLPNSTTVNQDDCKGAVFSFDVNAA